MKFFVLISLLSLLTGCVVTGNEQIVELSCDKNDESKTGIHTVRIKGVMNVKIIEGHCVLVRTYTEDED